MSALPPKARAVIIGGGVSGCSVAYHLAKLGWTDVVLLERKQLTAGSTWHAAGGMHTLNGDPNVARLQQYTVNLYRTIEAESGQSCSIHLPGGLQLADTPERLDWLRMAQARGRYLGMHMEMVSMREAKELNPLLEERFFVGALFDLDAVGVAQAEPLLGDLAHLVAVLVDLVFVVDDVAVGLEVAAGGQAHHLVEFGQGAPIGGGHGHAERHAHQRYR